MSSIGTKTGIGDFFGQEGLRDKVRIGLNLCKTNCVLNCGNCPYSLLKDDENNDISKCTSTLAADAEEFINSLIGNKIIVRGIYEGNNN